VYIYISLCIITIDMYIINISCVGFKTIIEILKPPYPNMLPMIFPRNHQIEITIETSVKSSPSYSSPLPPHVLGPCEGPALQHVGPGAAEVNWDKMLGLTMEHYDLTMENGRFNMIEPSNMMI